MSPPRGAVIALSSPKIGFLKTPAQGQPAVCVQPAFLTEKLSTLVVVPLLQPTPSEAGYPLYVAIPPTESGLPVASVAVCPLVRGVPLGSVLPGVLGQVSAETLARISRLLRLLQGL